MKFDQIVLIPKIGGSNTAEALAFSKEIEASALLKSLGIKVTLNETLIDDKTLIVPVGGDGTVLHATKLAANFNAPILGINLGNVGFLTDLERHSAIDALSTINDKNSWVDEDRLLLTAFDVDGKNTGHLAFNDFVISDKFSGQMIKYNLSIGANKLHDAGTHRGNAVVISTPTGSTGYSLSAGGAIVAPDADVIAITPVATMSMSSRPIIVHGDSYITVRLTAARPDIFTNQNVDSNICVICDGRQFSANEMRRFISSYSTDTVCYKFTFGKHNKKVTMVHPTEYNFFSRLTDKLGWNN